MNLWILFVNMFFLLPDLSFLSFLQGDNQVYWFQTSSFAIFALFNGCSSLSLASITTWWWPPQPPRRPPPPRITTCCSTASSLTAPRPCCGSSRARLEAARWPPQTGAATAEAPAAWCRPAACGTVTETETESETGTATPSQDCRGPRWRPRRQPFTAPYLTLSPLTRTQSELKDKGDLNNGSTCK